MSDPFEGPKSLIADAREDIDKLKVAAQAWFDSKPYASRIERNVKTGLDTYKIVLVKALPPRFSRDVSRIAVDLRSALDQTGYVTASAVLGPKAKKTYFPFSGESAANLESVIAKNCFQVPPNILAIFRTFKPYRGGDDTLWSLNELANYHKHRLIRPVGQVVGGVEYGKLNFRTAKNVKINFPTYDAVKNEIVLFTAAAGTETDSNVEITYHVAFGDVGTLNGGPVIEILDYLATRATEIVAAVQAEAGLG